MCPLRHPQGLSFHPQRVIDSYWYFKKLSGKLQQVHGKAAVKLTARKLSFGEIVAPEIRSESGKALLDNGIAHRRHQLLVE